ncbi:hypothetical protein [Rubritalea tangerina]|uniref:hypothetical protein n=1 Tax=Rubritalea tangerina TaxID=430798 RepID=UPI00360FEA4E
MQNLRAGRVMVGYRACSVVARDDVSLDTDTISRLGIDEWSVVESCEVCASRF